MNQFQDKCGKVWTIDLTRPEVTEGLIYGLDEVRRFPAKLAARLTDPTSRARLLTAFTTDADSRLAAELAKNASVADAAINALLAAFAAEDASVAPAVVTIRATIQCGRESPAIGAMGTSNWIQT